MLDVNFQLRSLVKYGLGNPGALDLLIVDNLLNLV